MFTIVYNITHVHASLLVHPEQASDHVQWDPRYWVFTETEISSLSVSDL